MYVKTRPVPFGEYIPFREQLAGLIGRFDRIPRDFAAGPVPGNLDVAGVPLGLVICFEIAYAGVVDAVVDGGAQLLAVQTNNATYGGTAQPAQQLAITRMRALEFGRTVVVAATSGISAVITPDGIAVADLGEDEVGWMVEEVELDAALTGASRFGHLVEAVLVALAAAGLLAGIVIAARRRPDEPPDPEDLVGWSSDARLVR
jgi:apolipoprotein N-acyltransferase